MSIGVAGKQEAPPALREFQSQFDAVVRTPIDFSPGRFRFQQALYPETLCRRAVGREGMTGRERLSTYNSQYWYRLFTVMQENYPVLCGKLGAFPFNREAGAYLEKHPSRHPSLTGLGKRFPGFLKAEKRLTPALRELARVEELWHQIYTRAEYASLLQSLDPNALQQQLAQGKPLKLQPSSEVFTTHYDGPVEVYVHHQQQDGEKEETGSGVWKQPAWQKNQKRHWVLLRYRGRMRLESLKPWEYHLLKQFKTGKSLVQAFAILESLDLDLEDMEQSLASRFETWARLGFFSGDAS